MVSGGVGLVTMGVAQGRDSGFRALATAGKHIVGRCVGQRSPAHMAHDVPVAGESAADDGDI